jgi:hypothetical protein
MDRNKDFYNVSQENTNVEICVELPNFFKILHIGDEVNHPTGLESTIIETSYLKRASPASLHIRVRR